MKKIFWIGALLFSLSCGDDEQDFGSGDVLLDGEHHLMNQISGARSLCLEQRVNFVLTIEDDAWFHAKHLDFTNVPLVPGEYEIQALPNVRSVCNIDTVIGGLYMMVADGDAIGDVYRVVEGPESSITIISYDAGDNELKGSFQLLSAYQQLGNRQRVTSAPDTLQFTQGEFQITVK